MTDLPARWFLLWRLTTWSLAIGLAAYLHNIDSLT